MISENWEKLEISLPELFRELGDVAAECFRYFSHKGKTINTDFRNCFEKVLNVLDPLQLCLEIIMDSCEKFDGRSCRGNGYRSLIYVVWKCMTKLLEIGQNVRDNRERLFFRSFHTYMELNSYVEVFCRLFTMVQFSVMVMDMSEPGCLFPDSHKHEDNVLSLLQDFESINRESFYGRSFGFQFVPSLRQSLQVIGVAMAAYGDGFDKHEHGAYRALYSFLHSGKYVVDPELRARRIVDLTQNVSVDFCKQFWSLPEKHGIQHVPSLICPTLDVNREFEIISQPFDISREDGSIMRVAALSRNKVQKKIHVHLLSYYWREGQVKNSSPKKEVYQASHTSPKQKSSSLIFHCHGGGFVAQSSKSHEIYLRHWAKELRAPILSINYSLSPGSTYPEALNECFYMYAWALRNADQLGTTAEKICFAGDSAGANLVVSLCLKAIQENIRLPDGIAVAYPPFLIQYVPSPSRILSLMDPLLPIGILRECLEAYSGLLKMDAESGSMKRGISKNCSSPFLGENSNPYHIDLGGFSEPWMPMFKSYSDSNLLKSKIESQRSMKEDFFASPSYQGPFPVYESLKEEGKIGRNDPGTCEQSDTASVDSSYSGIQMHFDKKEQVCINCYKNCATSIRNDIERLEVVINDLDGSKLCITCQQTSNVVDNVGIDNIPTEKFQPKILDQLSNSTISPAGRVRAKTFYHQRSHSDGDLGMMKRSLSYPYSTYTGSKRDNKKEKTTIQMADSSSASRDDPSGSQTSTIESHVTKEYVVRFNSQSEACCITDSNSVFHSCKSVENISSPSVDVIENEGPTNESLPSERKSSLTQSLLHTPLDPLMSPLVASDEMLKKLPRISILACALDPLLDDSVEFTKRLERLGNKVDLYVIEDLPHGFLQFSVVSNEAKEACDLMIACMKQILGLGMHRVRSAPRQQHYQDYNAQGNAENRT